MLDLSEFRSFGHDKLNFAKMISSACDRVEHIVGKGENAGHQHFLLFQQCFSKVFSTMIVEILDCMVMVKF